MEAISEDRKTGGRDERYVAARAGRLAGVGLACLTVLTLSLNLSIFAVPCDPTPATGGVHRDNPSSYDKDSKVMASGELPLRDTSDTTPENPVPGRLQRVVSSKEILQGGQEVMIEHEGEFYRLRLTRNGKLILQK